MKDDPRNTEKCQNIRKGKNNSNQKEHLEQFK